MSHEPFISLDLVCLPSQQRRTAASSSSQHGVGNGPLASASSVSSSLINLLDAPVDQLPGNPRSSQSTPGPATVSPPPFMDLPPAAVSVSSTAPQAAARPPVAADNAAEASQSIRQQHGPKFDVTAVSQWSSWARAVFSGSTFVLLAARCPSKQHSSSFSCHSSHLRHTLFKILPAAAEKPIERFMQCERAEDLRVVRPFQSR
jgi:hypothetical protein